MAKAEGIWKLGGGLPLNCGPAVLTVRMNRQATEERGMLHDTIWIRPHSRLLASLRWRLWPMTSAGSVQIRVRCLPPGHSVLPFLSSSNLRFKEINFHLSKMLAI